MSRTTDIDIDRDSTGTARAAANSSIEKLSHLLDDSIRIPGTNLRFGIDPIIGFLFPVVGDWITAAVAVYIVAASLKYGIPKIVVARMIFNIAVDLVVGSIPFAGDLFDAGWKCNRRNMALLKHHAGSGKTTWRDWLWLILLVSGLGTLAIALLILLFFSIRATGIGLL